MEQQHKGFSEGFLQVWGDKINGLFYHLQEPVFDIFKGLIKYKIPPPKKKKKKKKKTTTTKHHFTTAVGERARQGQHE